MELIVQISKLIFFVIIFLSIVTAFLLSKIYRHLNDNYVDFYIKIGSPVVFFTKFWLYNEHIKNDIANWKFLLRSIFNFNSIPKDKILDKYILINLILNVFYIILLFVFAILMILLGIMK